MQVCDFVVDGRRCNFTTESNIVLETHKSTAHINRNARLLCARCDFITPTANVFKNHMKDKHGVVGITNKPTSFFPCKLCFYETNMRVRLEVGLLLASKFYLFCDGSSN